MDLNAPLGMRPPERPRSRLGIWAAATAGFAVLIGIGVFWATTNPHDGEPYALAEVPHAPPRTPKPIAPDSTPTGSLPQANGQPPLDSGNMENGVKVFRGQAAVAAGPEAAARPLVINVTKALDGSTSKKSGSFQPFAKGGAAKTDSTRPRVAIFVSGMGLSQNATRTATEIMPAAVTLAFVPYGDAVSAAIDAAKAKGHEVLLQLPMQSVSGSFPGPHALKRGEAATDLAADLSWLMGRINAYAGVTNLLGAPVTSDPAAMTAILKAVGGRGLFYVDDGTSKTSAAIALAPSVGVRAAQADVVLDATSDPALVRANLNALIAVAKRKGSAIGMASGLPEHMSEIARLARDLDRQGVSLVPVSAVVGAGENVAAAR